MRFFVALLLAVIFASMTYGQLNNRLDKLDVNDLNAKKLTVQSTTSASKPCPAMSEVQRDALASLLEGQCVFNTTTKKLNIYDSSAWVEAGAGSGGGISNWETAIDYEVGDVVIESNKIYQANTAHTSTVFATQIANWTLISGVVLDEATGSLNASLIGSGAVDNTEFGYLNNATSEIQSQLNGKEPTITGAATTITGSDLTASRAVVSDASGKVAVSDITSTELDYLNDVTSNIQTQLNGKEPTITTLSLNKGGTNKGLTAVAGGVAYSDADSLELTGAGTNGQVLTSNGASAPTWQDAPGGEVSDATFTGVLSLGKGGTSKSLTASNGAIPYSDADSLELLAPGTSGQILQSNGVGAPSFVNKSISSKSEVGSSVTLEEIQVNNNQLTQTAVNKHLVESGNKNILTNPSFEHSTFSTGWTNSAGTLTEETVVEVHGLKAAKLVLSSQTMNLFQDSTLYASQYADGVQGLISVMVKSDVALKLCSRSAGVTSSINCVDILGGNKWSIYKLPVVLGATSNGLAIISSGNVSGTVYIDDAYVGTQTLTTEVPTCNGNPQCETVFSAKISAIGVVSDENVNWINANCTAGGSGVYTCNLVSGIFTVAANCTATAQNTSGNLAARVTSTSSSLSVLTINTSAAGQDLPFYISCQKQGVDYQQAVATSPGFSTLNADTDWQSCGHTTSSFTGFGTVSGIETHCKRDGSDLLMKGKFTVGVSTSVEARVNLPIWNGTQLLSAGTQKIPSIQKVGDLARGAAGDAVTFHTLIEPSVSYFTISEVRANVTHGLTKAIAANIVGNNIPLSFTARIPIEGWQNSNIIIGQFNGLERCTDSYECTDVFSATISSAGVVSNENVDWINGNASVSGTSIYNVTLKTGVFSVAPNCTAVPQSGSALTIRESDAATNTSLQFTTFATSTTNATASNWKLICQKQGADYIGKTAKAVASDQNLRTPGVTNSVVYSSAISSNGTVSNEIGDFINGNCTNADPMVCTLNSVISGTRYNCTASAPSLANGWCNVTSYGSSSFNIRCFDHANTIQTTSTTKTVLCHGVAP